MNKKQYEKMRNELFMTAQNLINEGKVDEANAKMEEIKELDEKWDAIAQAQANLRAMNNAPNPVNVFGNTGETADFAGRRKEPENIYDCIRKCIANDRCRNTIYD